MYKIGFVSLGCSKNLVDTEMIIGLVKNSGYVIENDASKSDIIIINTCGFIGDAKKESIDTILEMVEYKKTGNCKYLVVVGCLAQRYKDELAKLIPEIDLIIGALEYDKISEILNKLVNENIFKKDLDYNDRVISTPNYMAYLKIAEGCDNRCTYCAIPYIRGPFVSRKMEDILFEAKKLKEKGIKEIVIIAQDTTKYGIDIYGEYKLADLLENIAKLGFDWIRVLYTYPETLNSKLITVIRENKNICPYFDIPIQHIADNVLKRMGRKGNGEHIRKLISDIRSQIPNAIIRTTLIVGFPGETKQDFEELYQFVSKTEFDRLGVFKYSKEEGTPAQKLDMQIHPSTKKSRYDKIMKLQQSISFRKNESKIKKEYIMLVEAIENDKAYGRTYMDAPQIDGYILCDIKGKNVKVGEFIKVVITGYNEYDLAAKII